MDLNLLTALDALLDTGSVTLAAQRLHLSAPAMSHTLARIREALGDPILVRGGRKLVPTARAVELREPLRQLLIQARALLQPGDAQQLARTQREFVVRAPEGLAIVHGAGLIAALRALMPRTTLRFVPESDSDSTALRDGRIDLDIGAVHDHGPEVQTALLYEQQIVGAVKAGHPLGAGRVTLQRFVAATHVAIAQRGRSRETVDAALAATGHARQTVLTVPRGLLVFSAISDGTKS